MSDKKIWKPNAAQLSILEALKAEQDKERSAAEFVRTFVTFSASRWSRIMLVLEEGQKESYFDQVDNPDEVMSELEALLDQVRLQRANISRFKGVDVLKLTHVRAVVRAVQECKGKPIGDPERLVKYLAPEGGGKTYMAQALALEFKAKVVEAREAWKRSYYTCLKDISDVLKLRATMTTRPSEMEDALMVALNNSSVVLAIDEGEFFGASALNGLKLLLNKTRVVPVLCAIQEAHDRWDNYYRLEARQITRRTHAVVTMNGVMPVDAALFFPDHQFAEPEKALEAICQQANQLGAYSLVNRVAKRLSGESRAGKDEVLKAIKHAKNQMVREGTI